MKIFVVIFAFIILALSLSGCKTLNPGHPHSGDFCPPGQAKHGNC